MKTNARLASLVSRTLRDQRQQHGHVTLKDVTDRVVTYITNHGGFQRFGIGQAEILMALRYIAQAEVRAQFKDELPENTYGQVVANAPPILVQLMRGLPQYIALDEGPRAHWRHTLDASPDDWQMHANMKRIKAEQTLRAVNKPVDISRYLAQYGFASLGDLIRNGGQT